MKRYRKNGLLSVTGFAVLFFSIAVMMTIALYIYGAVEKAYDGNKSVVAAVMLVVIVFLSLVCAIIDGVRRRLTVDRPVGEILRATQKIAAGDFTVKIPARGNRNEYDLIAQNINKMAAQLSTSEIMRTDFISNVSHELKTPLAIIQNHAAALQDVSLDDAVRKEYAAVLVSASKRFTALVNNMLKLNKLENQRLSPERTHFRLDELIAGCVLQFEDAIERKQLELACDLAEMRAYSSPELLELVFNNLISNAVKFTGTGGKIAVTLRKEGAYALVTVSDTGCGISPEAGAHIFDKFYQGDTSHAAEGNGLGLALVKKVTDILGGEITVESEVGKGTAFCVKFRAEEE